VLGDARLSLQSAPDHRYGIIIVDAFSGDSIPVHLVTREALQLYLSKLTPHGILAFHITNTYLDLQPVLAALAADAGLVGVIETDARISDADLKRGSLPSVWVVIGRNTNDLGKLVDDSRWKPLLGPPGSKVWTDEFSSVISVFKWK
jgi:spermidine synthase